MKKKLIELQAAYKDCYDNGLIGISDNYIQIDTDLFNNLLFKNENVKIVHANQIELHCIDEESGVKFITLI